MSSGKFHGMIWPQTPSGSARRPRKAYVELVGPARVIEEVRGGERDVDVARLLDRLAAVHRLEHRELARLLLDQRARSDRCTCRARPERASTSASRTPPRRPRTAASTSAASASATSESICLGRGIDRGEVLLRARRDELAADEELVAGRDRDVIGRLGRRRVAPRRRRTRGRRVRRASFSAAWPWSPGIVSEPLVLKSVLREVVGALVPAARFLVELHQDVVDSVEAPKRKRSGVSQASPSVSLTRTR